MRAEDLEAGDLYGSHGQWSIVRATRPLPGAVVVIDHDPMVEVIPPEPWAAGVITSAATRFDCVRGE
ncbi:MAG: hypothetical protein ACR2ML_04630 [Solirubrobacteraceae bacterium]